MAKFNSELGQYAELWAKQKAFMAITQNADIIQTSKGWWKTQMAVDSMPTTTQTDGTAQFSVKAYENSKIRLMDGRAPLADVNEIEKGGEKQYLASLGDFGNGFKETAMEREYKEQLFKQFGSDEMFIKQWIPLAQDLVDMSDTTLTNMTSQLISKGEIKYTYGEGLKMYRQKADIPSENFKNAGAKVWTDPDCKLLQQMAKIETDWRKSANYNMPMVWKVTYDMFYNVVLKNAEVVEWVKTYKTLKKEVYIDGTPISEQMFREAIATYPELSPIEIVRESQLDKQGTAYTSVSGWDANKAVLCPRGYVGLIKHSIPLDVTIFSKYGTKLVDRVFSPLDGGMRYLINSTVNSGNLLEWHTDLIMSAAPTLTEFPYHIIVNTQAAG